MKLQGDTAKLAKQFALELEANPDLYPALVEIVDKSGIYEYDRSKNIRIFLDYGATNVAASRLSNDIRDYLWSVVNDLVDAGFEDSADNVEVKEFIDDALSIIGKGGDYKWNWKTTYKILDKHYRELMRHIRS